MLYSSREYLGVPIPTKEEVGAVAIGSFVLDNNPASIAELSEYAKQASLFIPKAIACDVATYFEYEAPEECKNSELVVYSEGIEHGYDFILSSFTYFYFLRSGYKNMADYLNNLPNRKYELPVSSRAELDRIKDVRRGKIPLADYSSDNPIFNAQMLTGDVFLEAPYFEDYMRLEFTADVDEHFNRGFNHGVEQAIVMYSVSREVQVLQHLDPPK